MQSVTSATAGATTARANDIALTWFASLELNWIRDEVRKAPKLQVSGDVIVVTLDEMWRFIQRNLQGLDLAGLRPSGSANHRLGCGWP